MPEGDPGPGALPAAKAAVQRAGGTSGAGNAAASTTGHAAAATAQLPGGVSFNMEQGPAALQGGQQRRKLSAALPPPRAAVLAPANPEEVDLTED